MKSFTINHLDHVAILVKDMELSIEWYQRVLGLKRYDVSEWGAYPVFLLAGKTGIAIFPDGTTQLDFSSYKPSSCIDHFAFNVDKLEFEKAQEHFKDLGIHFTLKDHHHFHSIYTKDPDGHTVELTTLLSDPSIFYNL